MENPFKKMSIGVKLISVFLLIILLSLAVTSGRKWADQGELSRAEV